MNWEETTMVTAGGIVRDVWTAHYCRRCWRIVRLTCLQKDGRTRQDVFTLYRNDKVERRGFKSLRDAMIFAEDANAAARA